MQYDLSTILIALLLTLIAGMSTGIGGFISFFTKSSDKRVLAGVLGLSAGVMVYISFVELLPQAIRSLSIGGDETWSQIIVLLAFFGGMGLIGLIDWLIPEDENPHELHSLDELQKPDNHHIGRTGVLLALAITIHNFPEGIATFVTALNGVEMAIPIVVAIAIHNIPEGIAVSVPIYQATGSRKKALRMTFLSGLAEPVGAAAAALFLMPFWSPLIDGICVAAVAGIMVYISFDELLPNAESHGYHHITIIGIIAGMAIMALSLLLL